MSEDPKDRLSEEEARRLVKTIEEVEKEEAGAMEAAKKAQEKPPERDKKS